MCANVEYLELTFDSSVRALVSSPRGNDSAWHAYGRTGTWINTLARTHTYRVCRWLGPFETHD